MKVSLFMNAFLGLGFAISMTGHAYASDNAHTTTSYMHEFTASSTDSDRALFAGRGEVITSRYANESIESLLQKADTQDPELTFELYSRYYQKNDYPEALKWLRETAEMNHLEAQFLLGSYYAGGKIVERNCEEAIKWLTVAAKKADATTIDERDLSQSHDDRMTEYYGEAAKKELGKARAFVCGHDFMATVRLWKDDETYLSKLENAKVGYVAAQDAMVYHYRDRAANLSNEANFWLHLATANNTKYQWASASQLTQDHIIDLEKDIGAPNKAELITLMKEKNLKTLALLPESAFETMERAFQGETIAQYRLSRVLFEESIKSYEEGYFWGLLKFKRSADWERDLHKETIEKPLQFLTAEQVQVIQKRAKEWRNLPR